MTRFLAFAQARNSSPASVELRFPAPPRGQASLTGRLIRLVGESLWLLSELPRGCSGVARAFRHASRASAVSTPSSEGVRTTSWSRLFACSSWISTPRGMLHAGDRQPIVVTPTLLRMGLPRRDRPRSPASSCSRLASLLREGRHFVLSRPGSPARSRRSPAPPLSGEKVPSNPATRAALTGTPAIFFPSGKEKVGHRVQGPRRCSGPKVVSPETIGRPLLRPRSRRSGTGFSQPTAEGQPRPSSPRPDDALPLLTTVSSETGQSGVQRRAMCSMSGFDCLLFASSVQRNQPLGTASAGPVDAVSPNRSGFCRCLAISSERASVATDPRLGPLARSGSSPLRRAILPRRSSP